MFLSAVCEDGVYMDSLRFIFPLDGDVLTPADGVMEGESLLVRIRVLAPAHCRVTVNEQTAAFVNEAYEINLPVDNNRNTLEAVATDEKGNTTSTHIFVYRFKEAYGKYRLAIDDIIWSMRDLAEHDYTSIFDCPFFGIFKRLHRDFSTCVHMNIYFTDQNGFDLTQMPDRYKEEFLENSHWLKFTFHAYAKDPPRIYRYSPYFQVYRDYHLVTNEIIRFAGKETMQTDVNGLHFAETTVQGARALRDCGIRCLVGYFIFDSAGDPYVSYYLNSEQTRHCFDRDFWVDRKENIIFSKDKMVIDSFTLEKIRPKLDWILENRKTEAGTMNFVTHEQYFYSFYSQYQPDYEEKIRTAVSWATEHGYKPCFLSDVIKEPF